MHRPSERLRLQDLNAAKLSTIRTYLLVALIFNVLALLAWLVWTVIFLIVIIGVIFIIPLVISILTLRRILRMRSAATTGDIATLKQLNSTGWSIIALLFAGIIPGVMLLIADGTINELNSSPFGTAAAGAGPSISQGDFKYCSTCGAKIAKSATFCPSCGAKQP